MKIQSLRKDFAPLGGGFPHLTLLVSEWPKLYGVLAILSAIGLKGRSYFGSSFQTGSHKCCPLLKKMAEK